MTDELTPEEREALESLPRERLPAGLEDRVVGAMRARGFLAGRARVVRLTNGRVAGLIAACVVLVVGAYSIGLQRGDSDEALQRVEPTEFFSIPEPTTAEEAVRGETDHSLDWKLEPNLVDKPVETEARQEAKLSARDGRSDAASGLKAAEEAPPATLNEFSAKKERQNSPSPPAARPMDEMQALGSAARSPASPLTFAFGGSALIVEAPDSVRVVQDEQGRVLLIYTSDGVIRIRLADKP